MGDEFSVFGQLSQLTPAGKPRDAKEVPLDKEARRRPRGKKKEPDPPSPQDADGEEPGENRNPSGKVLDIII